MLSFVFFLHALNFFTTKIFIVTKKKTLLIAIHVTILGNEKSQLICCMFFVVNLHIGVQICIPK